MAGLWHCKYGLARERERDEEDRFKLSCVLPSRARARPVTHSMTIPMTFPLATRISLARKVTSYKFKQKSILLLLHTSIMYLLYRTYCAVGQLLA